MWKSLLAFYKNRCVPRILNRNDVDLGVLYVDHAVLRHDAQSAQLNVLQIRRFRATDQRVILKEKNKENCMLIIVYNSTLENIR